MVILREANKNSEKLTMNRVSTGASKSSICEDEWHAHSKTIMGWGYTGSKKTQCHLNGRTKQHQTQHEKFKEAVILARALEEGKSVENTPLV